MVVKMSRKAGWTAALFGVGFATFALAQAPNPNDPNAVKAWQAKNGILEKTTNPATGWQPIAAVDQGMLMRGVLAPRNASGQALIGMRIEFFAAGPGVGNAPSLSELDTFMVDCLGNRIRQVERATFAQHNLGGDKKSEALTETSADGAWGPAAEMAPLEGTIRVSCAPPAGGGAQVAAAAPVAGGGGATPNPNDLGAVNRWLTGLGVTNIATTPSTKWSSGRPSDTSGWKLLGATPEGAFLGNVKVAENTLNDSILDVLVRIERFQPKPVAGIPALSQQTIYELNCRRKTVRVQVMNEFPQHNLSGESKSAPASPPDQPVAQTPLKDEAQQICTDLNK
jgi:hypothetical protein